MKTTLLYRLTFALVISLAAVTPVFAQHSDPELQSEHHALHHLLDETTATHVAISPGGSWSDPATWNTNGIPGAGARVHIPAGSSVEYDRDDSARQAPIDWIRVDGQLSFATATDTTLFVETLIALSSSTLEIGTAASPVSASCRVVITHSGPIDTTWDWHQLSRGIVTHGTVRMHGQEVLTYSRLAQDVPSGATQVTLEDATNAAGLVPWQPGDRLVLTGTELIEKRVHVNPWVTEDEVRTVASVSGDGKTITLDSALAHARIGKGNDILGRPMHGYVANFTRNVVIETENPSGLPANQRGHVMFMHNPDVDVRYVEFRELGRTDKSFKLDDFQLSGNNRVYDGNGDPVDGARTNIRGRYAVHFHRTGATDLAGVPARAVGNAVWGSPGWGFVHHDSHAEFDRNVAYNVHGAHFVAETGNEIGTWTGNLAIDSGDGGTGSGKGGEGNHDVATGGDGFWFQGRLIHANENIAVGMRGHGFKWFTRGVDNIASVADVLDFPAIARYTDMISSAKPAIQGFADNEAFACTSGLSVIKSNPNQHHHVRSHLDGFTAWEVKYGNKNEYTSRYTFKDWTVVGCDPLRYGTAFNFGNTIYDNVFVNCRVENFDEVFDWNGRDTLGQQPDYAFKFVDLDLINTTESYTINNSTAGVTDPMAHIEFLTSAELDPEALDLVLDPASNLDGDAGAVEIIGTFHDSIGSEPFPGGHPNKNRHKINQSNFDECALANGYWTDAADPLKAVLVMEEIIDDRATGERVALLIPFRWSLSNVPAAATYHGVWDQQPDPVQQLASNSYRITPYSSSVIGQGGLLRAGTAFDQNTALWTFQLPDVDVAFYSQANLALAFRRAVSTSNETLDLYVRFRSTDSASNADNFAPDADPTVAGWTLIQAGFASGNTGGNQNLTLNTAGQAALIDFLQSGGYTSGHYLAVAVVVSQNGAASSNYQRFEFDNDRFEGAKYEFSIAP